VVCVCGLARPLWYGILRSTPLKIVHGARAEQVFVVYVRVCVCARVRVRVCVCVYVCVYIARPFRRRIVRSPAVQIAHGVRSELVCVCVFHKCGSVGGCCVGVCACVVQFSRHRVFRSTALLSHSKRNLECCACICMCIYMYAYLYTYVCIHMCFGSTAPKTAHLR